MKTSKPPANQESISEPALPETDADADETIESIEEFIFDNENREPLNYLDLTNQS